MGCVQKGGEKLRNKDKEVNILLVHTARKRKGFHDVGGRGRTLNNTTEEKKGGGGGGVKER